MKDFKQFLKEHPFSISSLVDTMYSEYNRCSRIHSESIVSRLITASMVTMSKAIDRRLEDYHNWCNKGDSSKKSLP